MKKPRIIAYSMLFAAAIVTVAVSATSASTAKNGVNTPAGPVKGAVSAGGSFGPMQANASFDSSSMQNPVSAPALRSIPNVSGPNAPSVPGLPKVPFPNVGVPSMPNLPSVGDLPGAGSLPVPSLPAVPSLPSVGDPTNLLNGVTNVTGGLPSLPAVPNVLPSLPALPGVGSVTGLLP